MSRKHEQEALKKTKFMENGPPRADDDDGGAWPDFDVEVTGKKKKSVSELNVHGAQSADGPAAQSGETSSAQPAKLLEALGVEVSATQGANASEAKGDKASDAQGAEAPVAQRTEASTAQGAEMSAPQDAKAPEAQGAEASAARDAETSTAQGAKAPEAQGAEGVKTPKLSRSKRLNALVAKHRAKGPAVGSRKNPRKLKDGTRMDSTTIHFRGWLFEELKLAAVALRIPMNEIIHVALVEHLGLQAEEEADRARRQEALARLAAGQELAKEAV